MLVSSSVVPIFVATIPSHCSSFSSHAGPVQAVFRIARDEDATRQALRLWRFGNRKLALFFQRCVLRGLVRYWLALHVWQATRLCFGGSEFGFGVPACIGSAVLLPSGSLSGTPGHPSWACWQMQFRFVHVVWPRAKQSGLPTLAVSASIWVFLQLLVCFAVAIACNTSILISGFGNSGCGCSVLASVSLAVPVDLVLASCPLAKQKKYCSGDTSRRQVGIQVFVLALSIMNHGLSLS
jgi:hypothetical protein